MCRSLSGERRALVTSPGDHRPYLVMIEAKNHRVDEHVAAGS